MRDDQRENISLRTVRLPVLLAILIFGFSWSSFSNASNADKAWFESARRGQLQSLLKLRKKVKIEVSNSAGETALILAAEGGFKEVVKFLLNQKANINAIDNEGNSSLSYALDVGADDVSMLLLQSGVSLDFRSKDGNTYMALAAKSGRKKIIEELIRRDPHAMEEANNEGETPVMISLRGAYFALAEFLIKRGASINVVNKKGQKLIDVANESGVPEGHTFYKLLNNSISN